MEVGVVKPINIDQEMRESYLSYAMSVIVSRALPDARDGLKPVQRRILYAMYDMGLRPDTAFKKSARVVGEVLGKYHPHSDTAVYDAMVRMAQDFSMRYMLVDGQGNFGSIDGDAAAAMRYTEARLSPMGFDLLEDIGKNTIDFGSNFDDTLKEPLVLPATAPNLLVNGASGIAVGMATSIPPHNLSEVIDAVTFMIDNWKDLDDITVADLMRFIKGPDFPTGGIVYRHRGNDMETDALASAYATGRGRLTVQARAHVEQMGRNKTRIVITEIPYQVNKTNLLGRIADLHRDGKIEGLTDLRDESDRHGLRIIIELTRTADPEAVLNDLYRMTPLRGTFSVSLLALVNEEPRLLTLKQALRVYLEHRLEIVRRRSEYDLEKARLRAHILEGLLIALDNLDEVIDTIRRSRTVESASANLQKKFSLTEIQAHAILDMQLRRLAGLERRKLQEEYKEKVALIKSLEKLLSHPNLIREAVKTDLLDVKARFGDKRRTQVVDSTAAATHTLGGAVPDQEVWVMVGEKGSVSRTPSSEPINFGRKLTEQPLALLTAGTRDTLYLFSASGQAVGVPVFQLPETDRIEGGTSWSIVSALARDDRLAAALVLSEHAPEDGYLVLASLGGVVKRIRIVDLPGITSEPFAVMNVGDDDALGWVRETTGEEEIVLVTASGMAIRFAEESVRAMGLPAAGVKGIKLAGVEDGVVSMDIAQSGTHLLSITDNGLAKSTAVEEYPTQNRYGQGVINVRLPKGAAEVVAGLMVDKSSQLIVTTASGLTKRLFLRDTTDGSRSVKPRAIMTLAVRNRVTGAVVVGGNRRTAPPEPQSKKTKTAKSKTPA